MTQVKIYRDKEIPASMPVQFGMVVRIEQYGRRNHYIIARPESFTAVLIALDNGARWASSAQIEQKATNYLSYEEFDAILGTLTPEDVTIIGFAHDIVEIKE